MSGPGPGNGMAELVIRIRDDGSVFIENSRDGVKSLKAIAPESLLACIRGSLRHQGIFSGLLPKGCLSFAAYDNGDREITMLHMEDSADISYYGTKYENFPLPGLMFGFGISGEGRIKGCRLGVVAAGSSLKPATPMFRYPFGNVSGSWLCTGNNTLPRIASLHSLTSLPHYILSMDNNNDHFRASNNRQGLEMRDLLELLKDKEPSYYYDHVLLPSGKTLESFIGNKGQLF